MPVIATVVAFRRGSSSRIKGRSEGHCGTSHSRRKQVGWSLGCAHLNHDTQCNGSETDGMSIEPYQVREEIGLLGDAGRRSQSGEGVEGISMNACLVSFGGRNVQTVCLEQWKILALLGRRRLRLMEVERGRVCEHGRRERSHEDGGRVGGLVVCGFCRVVSRERSGLKLDPL